MDKNHLASPIARAILAAALLCAADARALPAGMGRHALDSTEVQNDKQPPAAVRINSVEVRRGHSNPSGVWVEDSEIGSASIYITPPADDRTAAGLMGYRIVAVSGCLPNQLQLPRYDVRAVTLRDGKSFLVLYWTDGAIASPPAVLFQVSVAAVDRAGNAGPETIVEVRDPKPAPGCPAGTRRCPSGACVSTSVACPGGSTTCPPGTRRCTGTNARCCGSLVNGCCDDVCVTPPRVCP